MITATAAVTKLREGNARFVSEHCEHSAHIGKMRRSSLLESQEPFAIILGCSDSRVPSEIIFDQGLGDLFVVRVAGNIVAPSQLGSIEFAVSHFDTPLVVVLGHTCCSAIVATLNEIQSPAQPPQSPHIDSILGRIRPALEPLCYRQPRLGSEALLQEAIRANVNATVDQLPRNSSLLQDRIEEGKLLIVGAQYHLDSGEVEFF